jgi:UDP-N-acetylglucosamine transferase subunit ALG13
MIFITVGAQMPFDRLVRTVDEWAARHGRDDVFAQVGPTDFRPRYIRFEKFLDPAAFLQKVRAASVVVAHAGMGSILTALEHSKPILVMPRRGNLMETRNDHQVATAEQFKKQGRVVVAMDENELDAQLEQIDRLRPAERISQHAAPQLLETLRAFIESPELVVGGALPAPQLDIAPIRAAEERLQPAAEIVPADVELGHQLVG